MIDHDKALELARNWCEIFDKLPPENDGSPLSVAHGCIDILSTAYLDLHEKTRRIPVPVTERLPDNDQVF